EPAAICPEQDVGPRCHRQARLVDADDPALASEDICIEPFERRATAENECGLARPGIMRDLPVHCFGLTLDRSWRMSCAPVLTTNLAAATASDADLEDAARFIASRRS